MEVTANNADQAGFKKSGVASSLDVAYGKIVIVTIGLAGQMGKTSVTKHMVGPKLGLQRVEVESFNDNAGEADKRYEGKTFQALAARINAPKAKMAIDVGASNVERVLKEFAQLPSTRNAVDYWVIPLVNSDSARVNAIKTVQALVEMQVDPTKIVLIVNNLESHDDMKAFKSVFALQESVGVHVCAEPIYQHQAVFSALKNGADSVYDVLATENAPDFDRLWDEAGDDDEKIEAVGQRQVLQDLAVACAANLDRVFAATPLVSLL
jgi:hypothetical protein